MFTLNIMTGIIKNDQNVWRLDVEIAWLNHYGMIFHEQQECGYGFPSQPLATCASAGVSESFLSTRGFATRA